VHAPTIAGPAALAFGRPVRRESRPP
jgi:hypothetical protein